MRHPPPQSTANARLLRHHPTDAEQTLWYLLRRRHLHPHYFRRQSPIGPYIADFLCQEKRLIIELDGGHHQLQQAQDAQRTKWLESRGYQVIRFWNNELKEDPDAVLQAILIALEAPTKSPPPKGKGQARGPKPPNPNPLSL